MRGRTIGRRRLSRCVPRVASGLALLLALLAALIVVPASRAELPPGYGGTLRMVAPEPVRVPDPDQLGSLFEASLAHAVFDPLEALVDVPPEPAEEGALLLRFRQGIRRQDRRPLRAGDVAAHLRRLARGPAAHWLAPLAQEGERPVLTVSSELELELRPVTAGADLRPLFALRPLAYRASVGTGTGPYRPRRLGSELRLFQFRAAARGAPYLRDWRFLAPRDRDDDLRALVLGEVEASFSGGSLHSRTPSRPVQLHRFPEVAPVLLVPNSHRMAGQWPALVGALDRGRLARVGLRPGSTLADGLPAPRVGRPGGRLQGELVMLVREGDRLGTELGRALAAIVDERGATLRVQTVAPERWSETIHRGRWHLRTAELPPPLPMDHPLASVALLVAAHAAAGDRAAASALWMAAIDGTLDEATRERSARSLDAVVLGRRRLELHLDAAVKGVRFDAAGRLLLGEAHLPRERTESP